MTAVTLFHKRKTLLLVIILFIAFPAFMADILDLREDLHIISCAYSSLDNNITTGITNNVAFVLGPIVFFGSAYQRTSINISFLHLFPLGLRAPPSWS